MWISTVEQYVSSTWTLIFVFFCNDFIGQQYNGEILKFSPCHPMIVKSQCSSPWVCLHHSLCLCHSFHLHWLFWKMVSQFLQTNSWEKLTVVVQVIGIDISIDWSSKPHTDIDGVQVGFRHKTICLVGSQAHFQVQSCCQRRWHCFQVEEEALCVGERYIFLPFIGLFEPFQNIFKICLHQKMIPPGMK